MLLDRHSWNLRCFRHPAAIAALCALSSGASLCAGQVDLVSSSSAGLAGNGSSVGTPSISADGRFVAFASNASSLAANDGNGTTDVFVKDILTGATLLLSRAPGGSSGNAASQSPVISADAHSVVYMTHATNVAGAGLAAMPTLVRYDMQSGTQQLAVRATDGLLPPDGSCQFAALSSDGRWLAFGSTATNLTPADTSADFDIFVRDTMSGTNYLVSTGENGEQGSAELALPTVSADGRYVAFATFTGFAPFDVDFVSDVYRKDLLTGAIERCSKNSAGLPATLHSAQPSISGDGRFVAFHSNATNLVSNDTNGSTDVFLRDMDLFITTRVSVTSGGAELIGISEHPSISTDGRFIAFESTSLQPFVPDGNGYVDVFVRDALSGTTATVSLTATGETGNGFSLCSQIAPNAGFVAFCSSATDFAGTAQGNLQIYRASFGAFGDLGFGKAGGAGAPRLDGSGTLAAGSPGVFSLENAASNAPALVLVSASYSAIPFLGGTLATAPPLIAVPIATDATGGVVLPFVMPALVSAPPAMLIQVAIADPSATFGVALSNAVVAWLPVP